MAARTFKKLCTGDGAGAVIPAGSKLGLGAGAEKAQNSWARLFASQLTRYVCKVVLLHFDITFKFFVNV